MIYKYGVLLIIMLSLTGCVTTSIVVPPPKPILFDIDEALKTPCKSPIRLPIRDKLVQSEVEKYWSSDRKNLSVCKEQLDALVKAIEARDNALIGGSKKKKE